MARPHLQNPTPQIVTLCVTASMRADQPLLSRVLKRDEHVMRLKDDSERLVTSFAVPVIGHRLGHVHLAVGIPPLVRPESTQRGGLTVVVVDFDRLRLDFALWPNKHCSWHGDDRIQPESSKTYKSNGVSGSSD